MPLRYGLWNGLMSIASPKAWFDHPPDPPTAVRHSKELVMLSSPEGVRVQNSAGITDISSIGYLSS